LAPQAQSNKFAGYKLDPNPLPCRVLNLAQPLCTAETEESSAHAPSFHALSQKLKTNQLVLLRSDSTDPQQIGAHAVYYVDHKGVWQVVPPPTGAAAAAPMTDAPSPPASSSVLVYEFEQQEDGDGLSFLAVAPRMLLLTRAGGRLTIFLANPMAAQQLSAGGKDSPALIVLFDGSPLCPAPLAPHHATLLSAVLSRACDRLFVALYEFWPQGYHSPSKPDAGEPISFTHESDAMRSAGTVPASEQVKKAFSAISSDKHALHKVTLVQFAVRNIPPESLGGVPPAAHNVNRKAASTTAAAAVGGKQRKTDDDEDDEPSGPVLDLVHSFSSVQNCSLPAEDVPAQCSTSDNSNWCAPLSCWLALPPSELEAPHLPVHLFLAARVPYLNETESVIYELARKQADEESEAKKQRVRDRADEAGAEAAPMPGIGAAGAAASGASAAAQPAFTSADLVGGGPQGGLKNYSIDNEDGDDEDAYMDESGLTVSDPSLRRLGCAGPDVFVHLYDTLASLLAKRPLHMQNFLFGHVLDAVPQAQQKKGQSMDRTAIIGVKQLENLVLYEVTAAPQIGEGTPVLAAGSVQVLQPKDSGASGAAAAADKPSSSSSSSSSSSARTGIVLTPRFSFAGLGYVQSGKPHKKFFFADPSCHYIVLAEYTRLVYVYGRPSPRQECAPQYLVQLSGDEEDQGAQIYGAQIALVPLPSSSSSQAAAEQQKQPAAARNAEEEKEATALVRPAKPLLYVLTRHGCRQIQLPFVDLEQPRA
jgi:hypothetical protein